MPSHSVTTSPGSSQSVKHPGIFIAYMAVMLTTGLYLSAVVYDFDFLFFLIFGGILLLAAALIRIDIACLFIPIVLANPLNLSETGTNLILSEYVLLIIFFTYFLRASFSRERYIVSKELLILGVFVVCVSVLSIGGAQYLTEGIKQIIRYVEVLLVFSFLIVNVCKTEQSIRRMVVSIIIGGFIASLIGIGQFIVESDSAGESRRIFGLLGGGYGAIVASTLMLCVGILLYEKDLKLKLFSLIVMPIGGIALIVSQTRAWTGSFIIVLVIMMLVVNRKNRTQSLAILGVAIGLVIILLSTDVFGLVERGYLTSALYSAFRFGKRIGEFSADDVSLLLRFSVWTYAAGLFLQNPLFGIGVGNLRFSSYFPPRLSAPVEGAGYVDNQYLHFFVETGIIGGIAWILYCYKALKIGSRAVFFAEGTILSPAAFGLYGSLLIFILGGFFWTITTYHEFFASLILIVSLLVGIERITTSSKSDADKE